MLVGIDCSRAFTTEPTGTENYARAIVRELVRVLEGSECQLVLFVRPGATLPLWVKENKQVKVKMIAFRYLWTQVGLALATWREKLDVLWVPAHTLPILRNPRVKTVVTIHGLEYRYLPEYRNWFQRWYLPLSTWYAVRAATRLIAVSQATKRDLLKEFGRRERRELEPKVRVVPEGVELPNKRLNQTELRKKLVKWGVRPRQYALFVGSLQPRKNLPAFIRAFGRIYRENSSWKLVIAGGRGWLDQEIWEAPWQAEIPEAVVFAGRVSSRERAWLYQGAGVYVQPSCTEGFGLPVLEAMGWGVPVVVSSGGALPEVAAQAGVVVPLGRGFERRLGKVISEILGASWREREQWGERGKRRAGEMSWRLAAEKTLAVLKNTRY